MQIKQHPIDGRASRLIDFCWRHYVRPASDRDHCQVCHCKRPWSCGWRAGQATAPRSMPARSSRPLDLVEAGEA